MPNQEELARAIGGLETLHGQLTAYTNGDILMGAILHSNATIDETIRCLDTALQVLNKRVDFHKTTEEREELKTMKNNWNWRYLREESANA